MTCRSYIKYPIDHDGTPKGTIWGEARCESIAEPHRGLHFAETFENTGPNAVPTRRRWKTSNQSGVYGR